MIRITCMGCDARLKAADEKAGRTLKCPRCRMPNEVPCQPPSLLAFSEDDIDDAPERDRRPFLIAVGCVIAVGIGVVSYMSEDGRPNAYATAGSVSQPQDEEIDDQKKDGAELAQEAYEKVIADVTRVLKFPGTATFADKFSYTANGDPGALERSVTIEAWVEAQNGLGVSSRDKLDAWLTYDSQTGTWSYVWLTMGNTTIKAADWVVEFNRANMDYREVKRYSSTGNRTLGPFDVVYSDFWRFQLRVTDEQKAGADDAHAVAEVIDSLGNVIARTDQVERYLPDIKTVDHRGTFRIRVKGAGRWEVVVQEPIK